MKAAAGLFVALTVFACGGPSTQQAQSGVVTQSQPEPLGLREFLTEAEAADGLAHLRSVPADTLPASCPAPSWSHWLEGASDGTFEVNGVCREEQCLVRMALEGRWSLHIWYENPSTSPTVTRCQEVMAR